MKYKLIGLHNHQCQFKLNDEVYIVPRKDFESKFNVYWFMGNLYRTLISRVLKNKRWLDKYKINETATN